MSILELVRCVCKDHAEHRLGCRVRLAPFDKHDLSDVSTASSMDRDHD